MELVKERNAIRSDKTTMLQEHKKQLDTAGDNNSRNMMILSAVAFILGIVLMQAITLMFQ
jgi:hypothetical protein